MGSYCVAAFFLLKSKGPFEGKVIKSVCTFFSLIDKRKFIIEKERYIMGPSLEEGEKP